jgi:hypothetical protein
MHRHGNFDVVTFARAPFVDFFDTVLIFFGGHETPHRSHRRFQ